MSGRKSSEVREAVAQVISGKFTTVYAAAKHFGVAQSSIHRDPDLIAWKAKQQKREGGTK